MGRKAQHKWMVIAFRENTLPQVVGAFLERQGAEAWIAMHKENAPLWTFTTAQLRASLTMPIRPDDPEPPEPPAHEVTPCPGGLDLRQHKHGTLR